MRVTIFTGALCAARAARTGTSWPLIFSALKNLAMSAGKHPEAAPITEQLPILRCSVFTIDNTLSIVNRGSCGPVTGIRPAPGLGAVHFWVAMVRQRGWPNAIGYPGVRFSTFYRVAETYGDG
jgi:hypothetical protein